MDAERVFSEEVRRANEITERFEAEGLRVDSVNLGGGLGVDYAEPDRPGGPDFAGWFRVIGKGVRRRPGRTVRVEPGAVSMERADCPDQICVRQCRITGSSHPIVCLPNRVEIRLTAGDGFDAVTGGAP